MCVNYAMYVCEWLLHTFAQFFSGLWGFSTGFRGILLACVAVCKARTIKLALSSIEDGVTVWHVFTIQKISKDNTSIHYIILPSIIYYLYIRNYYHHLPSITLWLRFITVFLMYYHVLSMRHGVTERSWHVLTSIDQYSSHVEWLDMISPQKALLFEALARGSDLWGWMQQQNVRLQQPPVVRFRI